MFSFNAKRKISFLLVFCIILLNTPSLDALAFGYKKPDKVMSGLDLSVGDILLSNQEYAITNEFYFWADDDVYHADKTTYSLISHEVLTTYDDTVYGYDSARSNILSSADKLILEYNGTSYDRDYSWTKAYARDGQTGEMILQNYDGHRKYPYNYIDTKKTDFPVVDDGGQFTFTLETEMNDDTNYIITAMVPEKNGNTTGDKTHYDYRIVLEPIPADVIVIPEVRFGDTFEGGKTYAFLLMEDEEKGLIENSNSIKFDLNTVYGIGSGYEYNNISYGADTISFTFDFLPQQSDGDVPLYTKHFFPATDTNINSNPNSDETMPFHALKPNPTWYSDRMNQIAYKPNLPNASVISTITYVTFPEGSDYEYVSLTVTPTATMPYPINKFTYNFISNKINVLYYDYFTGEFITKLSYEVGDEIEPYINDDYVGWITYDEDAYGNRSNLTAVDETKLTQNTKLYGIPKKVKTSLLDIEEAYPYYSDINFLKLDKSQFNSYCEGYFVLDPKYNYNINDMSSFKYKLVRSGKYDDVDNYPCVAYLPTYFFSDLANALDFYDVPLNSMYKYQVNMSTVLFYPAKVSAKCYDGITGDEIDISWLGEDSVYFSIDYEKIAENINIFAYPSTADTIGYSVVLSEAFSKEYPYLVKITNSATYTANIDDKNKEIPDFKAPIYGHKFFNGVESRKLYVGMPNQIIETCKEGGNLTYTVEKVSILKEHAQTNKTFVLSNDATTRGYFNNFSSRSEFGFSSSRIIPYNVQSSDHEDVSTVEMARINFKKLVSSFEELKDKNGFYTNIYAVKRFGNKNYLKFAFCPSKDGVTVYCAPTDSERILSPSIYISTYTDVDKYNEDFFKIDLDKKDYYESDINYIALQSPDNATQMKLVTPSDQDMPEDERSIYNNSDSIVHITGMATTKSPFVNTLLRDPLGHFWENVNYQKIDDIKNPGSNELIQEVNPDVTDKVKDKDSLLLYAEYLSEAHKTEVYEHIDDCCAVYVALCGRAKDAYTLKIVPHIGGAPVYEAGTPATCTSPGNHYMVTYCENCPKEINRIEESDYLDHDFDHSEYQEINFDEPDSLSFITAINKDVINKASLIDNAYNSADVKGNIGDFDKISARICVRKDAYELKVDRHECTTGDPVIEPGKEPTCTEDGYHYLVTKCTVCQEVLKREWQTDAQLRHDFSNSQYIVIDLDAFDSYKFVTEINKNVTDRETLIKHAYNSADVKDLIADFSVVSVAICVREDVYVLNVKPHECTPGDTVRERGKEPTCTEDGYHYLVTKCKICQLPIGDKKKEEDPPLRHNFDETDLKYWIIDFSAEDPYAEFRSLNSNVNDRESLVNNADNANLVRDSILNGDDVIVYAALCARAQDAYELKVEKAPTVTITVGKDTWNAVTSKVTFDIFYNQAQAVKILAETFVPGDGEVMYHVSNREVSTDSIQNWVKPKSTSVLSLSEYPSALEIDTYGKYVIYAKVTDANGIVRYASTNGIVFDNIAPKFSENIQDGAEISEDSITFGVDDEYLSQVWIDGVEKSISDSYTMENDKSSHTIEAVDKAGNKSSLTFTFIEQKQEDPTPTPTPTPAPSDDPSPTPTPTPEPSDEPSPTPTPEPTDEPTTPPTTEPTAEPTDDPTTEPTTEPTDEPSPTPTPTPTPKPAPTPAPTPTITPSAPPVVLIIPQTGLPKWPIWVLSLLGLVCIAVSVYLYKKDKDGQDRG